MSRPWFLLPALLGLTLLAAGCRGPRAAAVSATPHADTTKAGLVHHDTTIVDSPLPGRRSR